MQALTQLPTWQRLQQHYQRISQFKLVDLFAADQQRFTNASLVFNSLLLDYSKQHVNAATLSLLTELALEAQLPQHIAAQRSGKIVNVTEQRAALHTALRQDNTSQPLYVDGKNISELVQTSLRQMQHIAELIQSQRWLGCTEQPITDVVNLGIGGSDLGARMVCQALKPYQTQQVKLHFVANVDAPALLDTLTNLHPATTLFIVASKSFTTIETLTNANTAKQWLQNGLGQQAGLSRHWLAVTMQPDKAVAFGIPQQHILACWDWVGGRFSLWSAMGLAIMLAVGPANFAALLAGARCMDQHFANAPLAQNMPVILALLGIWQQYFLQFTSLAILPYQHHLHYLPAYLQQLHLESLGKSMSVSDHKLPPPASPIIWGQEGTLCQHTLLQYLLQSTTTIPVDFIVARRTNHDIASHQEQLFAACLAQSRALMLGKTEQQAYAELLANGLSAQRAKSLAKHHMIPGNCSSNTIVLDSLCPETLGMLLALYEHKVFVQSVIRQVNAFDQCGVEFGKQITQQLLPYLHKPLDAATALDSSTSGLLAHYRKT